MNRVHAFDDGSSIFQLCITINNIEQVRKSLSLIPETLQFNEIQTAIDNSNLPNKPKVDLMKILKDSDANMVGKIKQVVDRVADKVIFPDIIEIQTAIDNSNLSNKPKVDLMKILKDSDANMVGKIKQVVDRVADKVIFPDIIEIQTAIDNSNLSNKPKVDLMKILKDSDANMVGKIKQVVDRVADKVIFPDII